MISILAKFTFLVKTFKLKQIYLKSVTGLKSISEEPIAEKDKVKLLGGPLFAMI